MNTNAIIPTVSVRDQGVDRYLAFDWTDGRNIPDSVTLQLGELHADATVHAALVENVLRVVQHVYLMGHEAGQAQLREAREGGYMLAGTDIENPWPFGSETALAWDEGRQARLQGNEAGQRIEGLIGQNATERETVRELQRQLLTVISERDEALEALGHIQRDLISATVPTVAEFDFAKAATIYRQRSNFNVIEWVPEDGTPRDAGPLAAELRGVIADAYHAGRNEREGEMVKENQELRDAEANARVVVEQLQNTHEQRMREMQARIDLLHADFSIVRDALLEEAERRGWCSEYDEYAAGVNAQTAVLDLITRVREYSVTITVDQEVDYTVVDNRASERGFPISYDVSNATATNVDYHFTIESLEADIGSKVENLRRAIYDLSGISSATASWEESD